MFMVADVPLCETRHGHALARMAARAMARAELLQDRMLAAETDEAAISLNAACVKAERSARQSLALEMKLTYDNARAVRDQEVHDNAHRAQRALRQREAVARRREALRIRLERVAWDEVPDADWQEDFQAELHDVLNEEAELASFLDEPEDAQFERLWRQLGLGSAPEGEDDAEAESEADAPQPDDPDLSSEARSAEAEADDRPHEPFVRISRLPTRDSS